MKKIIFLAAVVLAFTTSFAQNEKYTMAMEQKMAAIDTMRKPQDLVNLSAAFERIADAEKTKWLPYYYAALTMVNAAYYEGTDNMKAEKVDPIADKAEALIGKAEALSSNNSEIYIVKKMIATLRMMADPMNRYMTYGQEGAQALEKAKALEPGNPRVTLLEAQDKFFTPEQFGGSKEEAKRLFEETLKRLDAHKPASALHPHWGRPEAQYFLAQAAK